MGIVVRPLAAADVPAAAAINRAAFSKFFGIPDPAKFRTGADVIEPRRRLWPEAALALELDGALAGAALMMRWGSVCILGPVTVAPEHWSKGLARALMAALIDIVDRGDFALTGLFTHPQSPKHIRLYEGFSFRMQRITAVMAKSVEGAPAGDALLRFSTLVGAERARALAVLRDLTGSIYPGLDVAAEVDDVATHALGETLLLPGVDGMALCHYGPGSEASAGQLLVKFAAVHAGNEGQARFWQLLKGCESYAASRGAAQVVAGTNTGRMQAYELMLAAGYRTIMNGIAMLRHSQDGYNRPDVLAIDDWR